jgi:methyl-accepting chemotaxis protein
MVIYCIVAAFAAYAAVSDNVASTGFQQLKDLLTFLGGLMGTVVGYYFGRVGVEKRAETAESTAQWAQTMQRTVEREAAQAVAQLDVEKMARDAAKAAKDLAEEAQEKAEQVAAVAEDAWQEAEAKVEQGGQVINRLTQGLQGLNDQVNTFKSEASEAVQEAKRTFDLVLDGDEETPAPATPAIDTQKLDKMSSDIDALLQMSAEWSG